MLPGAMKNVYADYLRTLSWLGGLVHIACFIDVELALPSAGKLMIPIAVSIECRDQR